MYTFNPMTDEELENAGLLEPGVYDFEVAKASQKISKSGNPMAELTLNVWNKDGKQHGVFDYLVFSNVPLNIRKVKHFCDATGLQEEYKKGAIPTELARYCGKVQINIQEEKPNPNGGMYPRKNIVVDYVMTEKGAVKHETQDIPLNDDVPF
jgi:hypothetical protein